MIPTLSIQVAGRNVFFKNKNQTDNIKAPQGWLLSKISQTLRLPERLNHT